MGDPTIYEVIDRHGNTLDGQYVDGVCKIQWATETSIRFNNPVNYQDLPSTPPRSLNRAQILYNSIEANVLKVLTVGAVVVGLGAIAVQAKKGRDESHIMLNGYQSYRLEQKMDKAFCALEPTMTRCSKSSSSYKFDPKDAQKNIVAIDTDKKNKDNKKIVKMQSIFTMPKIRRNF